MTLSAGVIVVAFAVQVGICILPRSGCTLEVGGGRGSVFWESRLGRLSPFAADGPPGRMSEEPGADQHMQQMSIGTWSK